jgi:mono/diheme cytochrome c family protein
MTKNSLMHAVLALALCLAGTAGFAQSSGSDTYKAKCAMCHGATGTPNPGMAKLMGIKPASDPEMKKLTVEQIETAVKNGKGKMKPVAGLSDAQIKAVAEYFKTLK